MYADIPSSLTPILLRTFLANFIATFAMSQVLCDSTGPFVLHEPRPVIMTTEEGSQVRAAVVVYTKKTAQQDHSKMRTLLQGPLAESDAEALLSLYQESKKLASHKKRRVESRGLWVTG